MRTETQKDVFEEDNFHRPGQRPGRSMKWTRLDQKGSWIPDSDVVLFQAETPTCLTTVYSAYVPLEFLRLDWIRRETT